MKIFTILALPLFSGLCALPLSAQDDPAVDLSRVAEKYVAAYNGKKIDDVLALFTSECEMIDEIDAVSACGIDEIRDIFETSFTKYPDRRISLEVLSVREVAANVVIEEGIARFSGEVPNEEGDSVAYSAVLVKDTEKGWLIASSREIATDSPDGDPLDGLYPLEGEWFMQGDHMQMELDLSLAPSGRYLIGSAYVTTPSEGTMENEIRIGFDPSLGQVRWWTFDDLGGFSEGTWQRIEEGWLIRTNGVTADGETTSAIQELTFTNSDTIVWTSSRRFLAGEAQPDVEIRLKRRPPAPSLSFDPAPTEADTAPEAEAEPSPEAEAAAAESIPSTSPKP